MALNFLEPFLIQEASFTWQEHRFEWSIKPNSKLHLIHSTLFNTFKSVWCWFESTMFFSGDYRIFCLTQAQCLKSMQFSHRKPKKHCMVFLLTLAPKIYLQLSFFLPVPCCLAGISWLLLPREKASPASISTWSSPEHLEFLLPSALLSLPPG